MLKYVNTCPKQKCYNECELYFGHYFILLDFSKCVASERACLEVPTHLGSLGNALSVTGQWWSPVRKDLYTWQSKQFHIICMKKNQVTDNIQNNSTKTLWAIFKLSYKNTININHTSYFIIILHIYFCTSVLNRECHWKYRRVMDSQGFWR